MSEDNPTLEELKEAADALGVSYHPAIGVAKLQAKIDEHVVEELDTVEAVSAPVVEETEGQKRNRLKKEQTKLIRCRITCMNNAKKDWDGEYFTVGNNLVGTITRFVPYNEIWHVEQILFNMIDARQCQMFVKSKDSKNIAHSNGQLKKEFSIEVLPSLTEKELKDLAQRQAMATGTEA